MGRKKKQATCQQQKYNGKSVLRIKQGTGTLRERHIKDKYKAILGLKEPVVVLKKLPENSLKIHRIISTNLKNDNKEQYEKKESKCNTHQVVLKNSTLIEPKRKRGRSRIIVPEEKELSMSSTESKISIWEVKHDPDLKNEALKNGEKLIVTVKRTKQYDQNFNVIDYPKTENKHNDTISNEVKIKPEQNTLKELNVKKNEALCEKSFVNLATFSHSAANFSHETNENYDINATKIRRLPTIIQETTLSKHSIKVILDKDCYNKNAIATKYLSDNTDLFKQKRLNVNQDNNIQLQKKAKVNNIKWFKGFANVGKTNPDVVNTANASGLSELNDKEVMPQMTTSSSLNNVELNSADVITDINESISETDKGIVIQDCSSLQNIEDPKEAVSNESSTKSQHATPVDDRDWDYISLDSHSSLIDEYCDPAHSSRHEKQYPMTDTVFDNYYKINKSEFNEMYENSNINNSGEGTPKETNLVPKPKLVNRRLLGNNLLEIIFKGYCYNTIRHGSCAKSLCIFDHNFRLCIQKLFHQKQQTFYLMLNELISMNYINFIHKLIKDLTLCGTSDIYYILKIIKRLYDLTSLTDHIKTNVTQWLKINRNSLRTITNQLATIVNDYDSNFINWFLNVVQNFTKWGAYWYTCRSLILTTKYLEPQIIQIILQECIDTRMHLQDVSINVIGRLDATVYCKINEQLLLTFNNLVNIELNAKDRPNISSELIKKTSSSLDENSETLCQKDICFKTYKDNNNNNHDKNNKDAQNNRHLLQKDVEIPSDKSTASEETSLTLHPIDGLTQPYSTVGRIIYWSQQAVTDIQVALKNCDYDRVMEILNSVPKNQTAHVVDACYKILCKEIIHSHCHLSKLVALTVRTGATKVLYQILLEIVICILTQLVEENYWVLAYALLKDVYIMLKNQINSHQLNATTILLLVEIYLANQQPLKALTLLKQSNVILTNPSNWKVRSVNKDNYSRVQLITFLFDELCTSFPEHAFFLFSILITDQHTNFHPIDLARFANKMVSVILQQDSPEMIVDVGRLIDDYCFTLNTITFRALIASLVNVDMTLAKQLYQKAINLGIYSRPQVPRLIHTFLFSRFNEFFPITCLIINSDWSSEELFLAISNLMKLLLLNIGHAIEYVSPRNLTVYLIFESVPSERELHRDTGSNEYHLQIKASQTLMEDVLARKFDPPLLFIKSNKYNKIRKLNNASVLAYLQTEHYE